MTSAQTSLGEVRTEGDPDAPLVRARQRGEPHPPKTRGRERISGLGPQGELPDQLLDRVPGELRELVEEQHPVVPEGTAMYLDGPAAARGADAR